MNNNKNVKHLINYLKIQITETDRESYRVKHMYLNLSNHCKDIWGEEKGNGSEDVYKLLKEYEVEFDILKFRLMWLQSQLNEIKEIEK